MREIKIILEEDRLPSDIHGMTSERDGVYYVLLNAEDQTERKEAAFLHELLHIYREDFKSGKTVDEIETEVRKELRAIKQYI